MRKLTSKKAVSDIVATVLIIMITVAAVGIIGAIVVPMVRESLTGGTLCSEAISDLSISPSEGFTCLDKTNEIVSLQISRGSKEINYSGARIVVYSEGESYSFLTNSSFEKNSAETFYLNLSGIESAEKVELFPIVYSANKPKECDKSSGLTFSECKLASSVIDVISLINPEEKKGGKGPVQEIPVEEYEYVLCHDSDDDGGYPSNSSSFVKGVVTLITYIAKSPFTGNFGYGSSSYFIPSELNVSEIVTNEDVCVDYYTVEEYYCSDSSGPQGSYLLQVPSPGTPFQNCVDGRLVIG